jgi:16S rRNA U1498 N3-methylase RsmE
VKFFFRIVSTVFAVQAAGRFIVQDIAQEVAPNDTGTQFIVQLLTQLGTSGIIVIILLRIRGEDEKRSTDLRTADEARHQTERAADRAEKDRILERLFALTEKSTNVSVLGSEIERHRRKRTADASELVLERLDEFLDEFRTGRTERKR